MNYFTADLHWGHERAINFPGRKGFTVQSWIDHTSSIINEKLTKHDRLYILGDFAFGQRKEFMKYRQLIQIKDVWLIVGNHEPAISICQEVFGYRFRITYETKVCGVPTILFHYPILYWNKSHHGSYHLFGHVHSQRTDYMNQLEPEMRSLDVSPESYKKHFGEFGIFSEEEINGILSVRKGHDLPEYYKQFGDLNE
ncbi:MAG TPA: hypothetical protein PKX31_00265 [Chitinophagaceae bacterium]|nr:hypothetical protein [Chitinophagaceae bacterium]